jgi:hypothetical protein
LAIHFSGDVTVDNYEFYGEFDSATLAKAIKRDEDWAFKDPHPVGGPPDTPVNVAGKTAGKADDQVSKKADDHGPKKIIVRQLGGAYLLARFTAVAWSVWYGPDDGAFEPWSTFRKQHLNRPLIRLFEHPREFDNTWQVSYRLKKCGEQYRVVHGGHEGFTPPLHPRERDEKDRLTLAVGNERVNLHVVNDRAPGHRYDALSIGAVKEDDWIVLKFISPAVKLVDRAAPVGHAWPFATPLKRHRDKTVGICTASDLRRSGAPISRALSWERTVSDVVKAIESRRFPTGAPPRHLVITFDYDGVLYLKIDPANGIRGPAVADGRLVFSIEGAEGDFAKNIEGEMPGNETAFVSAFAALLYKQLQDGTGDPFAAISRMLACALITKRRLLQSGFGPTDPATMVPFALEPMSGSAFLIPVLYYSEGIFSLNFSSPSLEQKPDPYITADGTRKKRRGFRFRERNILKGPLCLSDSEFLPNFKEHKITSHSVRLDRVKEENWSIFEEVMSLQTAKPNAGKTNGKAAIESSPTLSRFSDYVIDGKEPEGVPIGSFGKIKTADVGEIQAFRTVRALVQSYLSNPSSNKPLGIAVFGPPGAGKGFAVKNITETLPDRLKNLIKDDRHECNLTALSDPEDLTHYFQLSRNSTLRGKVPLLFFDEFDCSVERTEFYWLKHFLAPLQDGEFRSGHNVHPIGRAIFIFAGGVYTKYEDFADAMEKNRSLTHPKKKAGRRETQHNFKGVDFLSRLHGHIDVKAFSPRDVKKERGTTIEGLFVRNGHPIVADPRFLMRRAFVLRSLLEMHLQRIFTQGSSKKARIDRQVVNALLATSHFNHGARSMEAIIRMSYLENAESFEIAHLPPDDQLEMHVDGENFKYCLDNDVDALWIEAGKGQARGERGRPGARSVRVAAASGASRSATSRAPRVARA